LNTVLGQFGSWAVGFPTLFDFLDFFQPQLRFVTTMESSQKGPIASTIQDKLSEAFIPEHLEILNESYMHNVPAGSETHFKVVVVSDKFGEMTNLVARHRAINEVLANELSTGVHALSIVAKTPEQWSKMHNPKVDPSPKCRGGFGK
jgi:stress-induced morphogen